MSLFITGQVQKQTLLRKKHELQFQQMQLSQLKDWNLQFVTQIELKVSQEKSANPNTTSSTAGRQTTYYDMQTGQSGKLTYEQLKEKDKQYELQMDSLETELESVNADLKSFEGLVQQGAKEGSWWCIGN